MTKEPSEQMSHFAWAVLGQLARGPCWDGDIISKRGRTELVQFGLAQRQRKDDRGLMINELTPQGLQLAAKLSTETGHA